ncbi:hypothetical protein SDC9_30332 [bioreactor metagenome]|uniref:TIGR00375 family protein n=1 Tax=bioreactor metagenome TaxID=1076179 RepID=A0A644UZG3_9ZZZZ|nr:endonuclease Q family protein [Negativicutes bacterium]
MKQYFADLHIHVGVSSHGSWVKIPTSHKLTVENIFNDAVQCKGMDIIGIVDALSPLVLSDLEHMVNSGQMTLVSGGGYQYQNKLTVLLGAEIETAEEGRGLAHTLVYLPDIKTMREFSRFMSSHIKNINLSSQNARMPLKRLIQIAADFHGIIIPAHIFTPHKSLFGTCCSRLTDIMSSKEINCIDAVELGLSADSLLADRISELSVFSFVTNSDAHSLAKIAREYTVLQLTSPSFTEYRQALHNINGRKIEANYGLDPRLGKYHRTFCSACGNIVTQIGYIKSCPICGSNKIINGVFERIESIADFPTPHHPANRSPYFYQIPLEFIPGLGRKAMEKLLARFGTEMNIIHKTEETDLSVVVGERLAHDIVKARKGKTEIDVGGGGLYGKLIKS